MQPQRNATPGSSQQGHVRVAKSAGRNVVAQEQLLARRETVSSSDESGPQPGPARNEPLRHRSRPSQQRGSRPPHPAGGPAGGLDEDLRRRTMRKPFAAPPSQNRRPQSSFTLVAPLLRARPLPTKSGSLQPSFLVAEELREKTVRKENKDDGSLGPTRNAPRTSLPSMSVQRRVGQSPRKTAAAQQTPSTPRISVHLTRQGVIPDARVHVGRGGRLVFGQSDSDDTSSDSDESDEDRQRRIVPGMARKSSQAHAFKAARKTKVPSPVRGIFKAARKLRISSDDPDDPPKAAKAARKREGVLMSASDKEVIVLSSSDEEIDELREAFDALTLGEARLQQHRKLPFLRRNLWRGFERKCVKHRVRVYPPNAPNGAVKVVYKYYLDEGAASAGESSSDGGRESQIFIGSVPDWRCPICELHKPFNTREMLVFHLSRDHAVVKTSWSKITVRDVWNWKLELVIPDVNHLEESSSEEDAVPVADEEKVSSAESQERSEPPIPPMAPIPQDLPESEPHESPSPVTPPTLVAEEEEKKPFAIKTSPRVTVGRPSLSTATRRSYRGSLPARYPSPPPPSDKLGPAAQPPYLPETGPDGNELYSCRIGGPRIFDLLQALPMDEFGIMAWEIIDREEDLFEMEDVRDEDKVMLALWNRWIMLNRRTFIFQDHFEGVKEFVDKYWGIIHQAAGWRALRAFLIMLCVNKYLTFDKVVKTLAFYEEKTGMKLWYEDIPEER